ncbi:MAG: YdcF family protein [Coriobacteriia bacterium]|nr:YdcF family protein [Coriobacteriia bacterium]
MKNHILTLVKILVILAGILLILNAVYIAYVSNFQVGQLLVGALGLALVLYGIAWYRSGRHRIGNTSQQDKEVLRTEDGKRVHRTLPRWLHVIVILACTCIIGFCSFFALYGSNSNADYTEDAVIVLGASVHGEQVSLTLAHRLDQAIAYHAQNPEALIVVSGGQGPQEHISEALAMERYLLARGVSEEVIIKEDQSTSTLENFLFSDIILQKELQGSYTAVLITTDFHVYRASGIAQHAGIDARHMGAPSLWYAIPVNYLREILAVMQFWLLPPSP